MTDQQLASDDLTGAIQSRANRLSAPADLESLVDRLGDAQFVLLGEASHGTAEYYRWRARITARLIREHDFSFVAVEGDWPDCYRINRYVRGMDTAADSAHDVLQRFERWPTWMWANWEVQELVDWLHAYNQSRDEGVGFYGLDVYSLHASMEAVIDYLQDVDPDAAEKAKDAYACFDPYGMDAQKYARSTRMVPESCEEEVVEVLTDLRQNQPESVDHEEFFNAEQNAIIAKGAEEYYRAMGRGGANSWNVRDEHMAETLDRLVDHHDGETKAIVWAHNTHVGDARATDMKARGSINIGQLVRERNAADDVAIVGFGSHRGDVIAADGWGEQMEVMPVPPARDQSYEEHFHRAIGEDAWLWLGDVGGDEPLNERHGHRAIGVVYHPERESGNYVPTNLADRYDAFVYLDETKALHPYHLEAGPVEEPETFPWGV